MSLTEHFTRSEMEFSETALRRGVMNVCPEMYLGNLSALADRMEWVREILGNRPIHINSGYRSPMVNTLIKGDPHSDHMTGQAADFICKSFGTPYDVCLAIKSSSLKYVGIVLEFGGWVHLTINKEKVGKAHTVYSPGKYLPGILTLEEYGKKP